ncbi:hypothetical protein MVEN_02313400 [Mycena venus]|uniref:Uncharacterized protein n=1 Tax=Mycena venus TaxID=2733690 RepID=A0A8H7CFZ6_9AGAR|nr:hypothetical protein MVEN_02313400 [Mycena venus]
MSAPNTPVTTPTSPWEAFNHSSLESLSAFMIDPTLPAKTDPKEIKKAFKEGLASLEYYYKHFADQAKPCLFHSFYAGINRVLDRLDNVPDAWQKFRFEPGNRPVDPLPLEFEIPYFKAPWLPAEGPVFLVDNPPKPQSTHKPTPVALEDSDDEGVLLAPSPLKGKGKAAPSSCRPAPVPRSIKKPAKLSKRDRNEETEAEFTQSEDDAPVGKPKASTRPLKRVKVEITRSPQSIIKVRKSPPTAESPSVASTSGGIRPLNARSTIQPPTVAAEQTNWKAFGKQAAATLKSLVDEGKFATLQFTLPADVYLILHITFLYTCLL